MIEYINENHPDWSAEHLQSGSVQLVHMNHSPAIIFFYTHIISVHYINSRTNNDEAIQYSTDNILQIIEEIISKAKEH